MPKKIIDKEGWVEKGFQKFAKQGINGIVVEKISKELGCSKSSFYWHFKTKEDYVKAIINFWIKFDTEKIIEQVNSKPIGKKQFIQFIRLVFMKDEYLDFIFYLKRYAIRRKQIGQILDLVELQRLEFIVTQLLNLGYQKEEAITKAKVFYSYLIGYHERYRIKKQSDGYMTEVMEEIRHFIKIDL